MQHQWERPEALVWSWCGATPRPSHRIPSVLPTAVAGQGLEEGRGWLSPPGLGLPSRGHGAPGRLGLGLGLESKAPAQLPPWQPPHAPGAAAWPGPRTHSWQAWGSAPCWGGSWARQCLRSRAASPAPALLGMLLPPARALRCHRPGRPPSRAAKQAGSGITLRPGAPCPLSQCLPGGLGPGRAGPGQCCAPSRGCAPCPRRPPGCSSTATVIWKAGATNGQGHGAPHPSPAGHLHHLYVAWVLAGGCTQASRFCWSWGRRWCVA